MARNIIKHKICMRQATREERTKIVNFCCNILNIKLENAAELAKLLQGKSFKDIQRMMSKLAKNMPSQDVQKYLETGIVAIERERKFLGEKSVRIPEVKWADVGGLAAAKEDIL
jgi:hypothetical protein